MLSVSPHGWHKYATRPGLPPIGTIVATSSIDQVHRAELDAKNSSSVDDYLKLSVLYYHSQQYEKCIQAAHDALGLRPNLAEAYANMAAALHTLGRDDEAITALREVVRLRPDMAFAKTDLEILDPSAAIRTRSERM